MEPNLLLPAEPFRSLADYLAAGGGRAVARAHERGADWVLDELDRAGLRGRGGAGFPAGRKWRSVASGGRELGDRYVVANGAEGEPGTFKDRRCCAPTRTRCSRVSSVAATVVGAREAFLAVKASFTPEIEALERALREMADAGLLGDAPVTLVGGPEEYLFGEEKALLEVIEGNDPMPRWLPPYVHGLYATTPQEGWSASSGAVDVDDARGRRVEPDARDQRRDARQRAVILTRGAEWYRTIGTAGDARAVALHGGRRRRARRVRRDRAGHDAARGDRPRSAAACRPVGAVKAVLSGVSNPVLTAADLDAPVSYEGLAAAGGGLGSAGFIVYDDTRDMVAVARMVSRFLYVESCGQCRACKFGCGEITAPPRPASPTAHGDEHDVESIGARLRGVTDQNRCFLGEEEQRVIASLLRTFPEDFTAELEGAPLPRELPVPKIVDIHDGVAIFDERQMRKQPDWTYSPPLVGEGEYAAASPP